MTEVLSPSPTATRQIHLVFKTHLDLGFTDLAGNVVNDYIYIHIPRAMHLARELRQEGFRHRFVWTTGSWLIREFLERSDQPGRAAMEEAIEHGDVSWHALPFTTHSELLDVSLFDHGLSISQKLDSTFGKKTIAAKMTDVPGHTRAMLPSLTRAGVRFLHIGVNPVSSPPDVPDIFVWKGTDGSEVVVAYSKKDYGDLVTLPGSEHCLAFAHTGDNLGPQEKQEVVQAFETWEHGFPDQRVSVSGCGMNAFARRAWEIRHQLPILEQEIGDTWIHGLGTDPHKVSRFVNLQRFRSEILKREPALANDESLSRFSDFLLLVAEHTWGRDVKRWGHREGETPKSIVIGHYETKRFHDDLNRGAFSSWEASWWEQRRYLDSALESLSKPLKEGAISYLACSTIPPKLDIQRSEPASCDTLLPLPGHWAVQIDSEHGALTHCSRGGSDAIHLCNGSPMGLASYETFTPLEVQNYYQTYNREHKKHGHWGWPDFGKPGLEKVTSEKQTARFKPRSLHLFTEGARSQLLIRSAAPADLSERFGCPPEIDILWSFPHAGNQVECQVWWNSKQACRIPEAIWFQMNPAVSNPTDWSLVKMGQDISPLDIVKNGNRRLHGVEAVRNPECTIRPLNSALVAPGRPGLYDFDQQLPDLNSGWHFNLYNNIWGTNFPFWYGEPAHFRFVIEPSGPN